MYSWGIVGSNPASGAIKLKFNLMKTEIKDLLNDLVESVLNNIGDQLKNETLDTRKEIINRNVNIALFKMNEIKKKTIREVMNKLKGSSKSIQVYNVLNEEL